MVSPSYERSFASHPKAKFWSKNNGDVKPKDIYKGSNCKKYWFDCEKCLHVFDSTPLDIISGCWCPYCSFPCKKLCKNLECDFCLNNSFASHEKAKYWSVKNGDLKSIDVFKNSHTSYWFDCDKCPHDFDSPLNSINRGRWCPYCANTKLCKSLECDFCLNNSFASHEKAKCWSVKNGDVTPRDVFKQRNAKYWFDCDKCSHDFNISLNSVAGKKGNWCSQCTHQSLCKNQECNDCLEKSFKSHPRSQFWSMKNGDVTPRDMFKSTSQKCWFDCDICNHPFDMALSNIVIRGSWCICVKNKTEHKMYEALKPLYPTLITQYKQEWCKNINCLPFDFCIPEYNILMELDGAHHFIQVSNWKSPEETFETDLFKEKCANDQGYSMIRIVQEDVFGDKHDWLSKLQTEIENIITDNTIIHNIYICENGEYDKFMLE